MNFLKKIFGVSEDNTPKTQEEKEAEGKKNFDILKYDGVRALKTRQVDYAVECFNHALEISDDLEIRDYLSQAYMATGELTKAYEQLQMLAEAQPDNVGIFIRMAHVAYMMEDYVIMGTACEKALLAEKDSPEALYLYAKACVGTGDVTNAIAMLTKALSVKPDYADAYLLRGEVLVGDGKLDEADHDAAWLLDKFPDNEDVLMLKANIERAYGHGEQAVGFLSKVIDANPFRAEAYKLRGELRGVSGDAEGAEEDLAHAAELAENAAGEQEGNIENRVKEAYANSNPLGL